MLGGRCPAEGSIGWLRLWQSGGHSKTGGGCSQIGKRLECQRGGVEWGLAIDHQEVLLPPTPGQGCPGPTLAWGLGEGWRRAIQEGTSVTRRAPEALLLL